MTERSDSITSDTIKKQVMLKHALPDLESLPPDYYLSNFEFLLTDVENRYGDFLVDYELQTIQTYKGLSLDARKLLVRCCMRKYDQLAEDSLGYSEIENQNAALFELKNRNLVRTADFQTMDVLLNVTTIKVFKSILPSLSISGVETDITKLKKKELINILPKVEWNPLSLINYVFINFKSLYLTLLTLFFGTKHKSLSDFIIPSVQDIRYENYNIYGSSGELRYFRSRQDLDRYIVATELEDKLFSLLDQLKDCDLAAKDSKYRELKAFINRAIVDTKELIENRFLPKKLNSLIPALEKYDLQFALNLYSLMGEKIHLQNVRKARVIELLIKDIHKSKAEELQIELKGLKTQLSNTLDQVISGKYPYQDKEFAFNILYRCREFLNRPLCKLKSDSFPKLTVTLRPDQSKSVEELGLDYLKQQGWRGLHGENLLVLTLFGLTFWDVIFADSPGAFQNQFQYRPLDLYDANFLEKRSRPYQLCLKSLSSANFIQLLINKANEKESIQNPFIHWKWLTHNEEFWIHASKIPLDHLISIFNRIWQDVRSHSSGLPDLFVWRETQDGVETKFIEIKGPGDKLQPHQKAWIQFMNSQSIDASVLFIEYEN